MTECGLGDVSIGMTAGSGSDGAGDTDLREEKEDLLLWDTALVGGFIGRGCDVGVPGAEGIGDAITSTDSCERKLVSWGAGLLEEIRRPGRSARM